MSRVHDAMPVVVEQLSELWSLRIIKLLFDPLFTYIATLASPALQSPNSTLSASVTGPFPAKSTSSQAYISVSLHIHDLSSPNIRLLRMSS